MAHVEMEVACTCFVSDHSRELQEQRWRLSEPRYVGGYKVFLCGSLFRPHTQTDFRSFKMELFGKHLPVEDFQKTTETVFFHTGVLGLDLRHG